MVNRRVVVITGVMLVIFVSTGTWAWNQQAPRPQGLVVRVNQEIAANVRATGYVALSEGLTAGSTSRAVRVLAYGITVSNNGVDVVKFVGIPTMDAERNEPSRDAIRTKPSANPVAGDEHLPRRCSLVIRPKDDRTWGSISGEFDLDIVLTWEGS